MVFRVPRDSLAHRYPEAYREKSWEGVRGKSGLKILPKIRTQIGPTCVYVATVTWMEAQLRLMGIECELSWKDLQIKEQELDSAEVDRTLRCMSVLNNIGLISEDDFRSQNPDPTIYKLTKVKCFLSLYEPDCAAAVERMDVSPLFLVFHTGVNYESYVKMFQQRPVLSYERYEEGKMGGHAVCAIGYGTEGIVPFWKFMNSYGKQRPTRGLGRVLPQNVIYLIAPEPDCLEILVPKAQQLVPMQPLPAAQEPAAPQQEGTKRRKRERQEGTGQGEMGEGGSASGPDARVLKKKRLDR